MRQRNGFTLIELLVVIAIIAILAAILLPVFARARENARKSTCQNNMKQIGTAVMQYAQDYDEYIVKGWRGAANGGSNAVQWKWMDAVYPYIKSEAVFNCPSNSSAKKYLYDNNDNYGSYRCNSAFWGSGNPAGPQGKSLADLQNASDTIWAVDGDDATAFECAWKDTASQPTIGLNANGQKRLVDSGGGSVNCCERHLDTVMVNFLDGHCKAMKIEKLAERNANGVMRYWSIQDD